MSKIPSQTTSNVINLEQRKQQNQIAGIANFDNVLSSSESNHQFIDSFLDNISGSLNSLSASAPSFPNSFPFTAAFQTTFGLGGPLPAFINLVTAKLHLTAAQNFAFQDIAVKNKDATRTPASIQKIATELKAAGIGF